MNESEKEKIGFLEVFLKKIELISSKIGDLPINYFYPLFNSVFVLDNYRRWVKELNDGKRSIFSYAGKGKGKTFLRIFLMFSVWSYFFICLVTGIHKIIQNHVNKNKWTNFPEEKFPEL